ncbi:MAG: response regulator transcription factor, partial [Anaerolineae bacterium]|nr:response regulator transcription factor [Anaerolineae bacterium]
MDKKIRVILADDHILLRQGIRQFLDDTEDIEVVAEADDGATVMQEIGKHHPDIAVLDIRMPGLSGVEAARRIRDQYPAVKILILTAYDDDPYVFALLQIGADGYILKTARAEELIRA